MYQPLTLLIKSIFKLRSLIKNPDQVNEAFLLFDKKNLVDLNKLREKQEELKIQHKILNEQKETLMENTSNNNYRGFEIDSDYDGGVDFEIKTVLDNAGVDSMQFLTHESYVRIFNTSLQFMLNITETVSINSFKFPKLVYFSNQRIDIARRM